MAHKPVLADPGKIADITLLLEGTYPYVSGGVSSWVHQIIRGLPEFTFSLVFLGGRREDYGKPRYQLPDHVIHLETHYLTEWRDVAKPRATAGHEERFAESVRLHQYFRDPAAQQHGIPPEFLSHFLNHFGQKGGITREDFLFSEASWSRICEDYTQLCTDPSFVDYFWTVRTIHAPLFLLSQIAQKLPPSRTYHAISTGYAGLLGAFLRYQRRCPFILTEHGIYTKERKIDLAQADWIKDASETRKGGLGGDVSYIRRLWIRFFEGIGRLTYAAADPIVTLYEGNRKRQIKDGAEAARTRIIANGIDLDRFAKLRAVRPKEVPRVLGLIGRVVPIKDIKTFIRTMRAVCNRLPGAEGWIIGPTDEDKGYARECEDLVKGLGLVEQVKFLGFQKVEDILPKLGLLVLTSISEALPLVLLEGFASGVPGLSTDVGACREIIDGGQPEDQALGSAGAIVSIADPEATARAAVSILTDPARWHSAQAAGIARVERFYTQKSMLDAYRNIYRDAVAASPVAKRETAQ
jgi:glycosyltransferase involved in cell wall biosynthesis